MPRASSKRSPEAISCSRKCAFVADGTPSSVPALQDPPVATSSGAEDDADETVRPPALRILFLSQRVPFPPNRGDKITTWRLVDRMRRSHEVTCVAFAHDQADLMA